MKFAPEKKIQLEAPLPIERVREALMKAASEKKQKNSADPDFRPLYGKVTDSSFKLAPNAAKKSGYSPVIEGDLTEVTESKPGDAAAEGVSRVFTRLEGISRLRPAMRFFSIFWAVLCVAVLGLALWLCFAKGFEKNWWTLLIGPALFLLERIVCGISFASNAKKLENMLKKLIKG